MPMDTHGRIRTRAYSIWEAEGRPHGRDLDHWLQAEMESRQPARRAAPAARAKTPAKTRKARAKAGAPAKRQARAAK